MLIDSYSWADRYGDILSYLYWAPTQPVDWRIVVMLAPAVAQMSGRKSAELRRLGLNNAQSYRDNVTGVHGQVLAVSKSELQL